MLTFSDAGVKLKDAEAAQGRRAALDRIYKDVPRTSCECDHPGSCCDLTEEEKRSDFATMWPLYAAEYLNIVDYLESHFNTEDQDRLFSVTEERPARCPFLTAGGGCSIRPVRPLTCRTYGVLGRNELIEAARRHRDIMPLSWINGFLSTESTTVCSKSRVLNPEKAAQHAAYMILGVYDDALTELSKTAVPAEEARGRTLRRATGLSHIRRWTWGGFNALVRAPLHRFLDEFPDYWKRSMLGS